MEDEQAVFDWVNTFNLSRKCRNFEDLNDGILFLEILHEICPHYFEPNVLNQNIEGNWALAAGNLRKLLRLLENYFKDELFKTIDMSNVDVNAIAKSNDPVEITKFLELLVGAAVMCEDKATFISKIFQLDHNSQAVLKALVEQVMSKAEDIQEGGGLNKSTDSRDWAEVDDDGDDGAFTSNHADIPSFDKSVEYEDLIRANEMIQHLQMEQQHLMGEVTSLQRSREVLEKQLESQQQREQQRYQEQASLSGNDLGMQLAQAEAESARLRQENSALQRELDSVVIDKERLQTELSTAQLKIQSSKEQLARLEISTRQQADELDLARDQAARLVKAEQSVEKYQKKLEEMVSLKKQNKELNDKMDQYLDQIQELESANKSLSSLNKVVEQYKNRAVEEEREKFEAISSRQTKEQEAQRLQQDLDSALAAQRMMEDELQSLRSQLLEHEHQKLTIGVETSEGGDVFEVESISSLREKVRRLERELQRVQQGGATADTGVSSDVELLKQELEYVKTIKKEREDALLGSKKQVSDLQYEISKLQRSLADGERDAEKDSGAKELKLKLAESNNTIKLLEETLKTKETSINRLEQEKSKLESYTKRSLATFKERFMGVLQTMKDEKRELEARIQQQMEKAERNQETWHREERLISSAMFEVGLKIMDRKIQSQQLQDGSPFTASLGISSAPRHLLSPVATGNGKAGFDVGIVESATGKAVGEGRNLFPAGDSNPASPS